MSDMKQVRGKSYRPPFMEMWQELTFQNCAHTILVMLLESDSDYGKELFRGFHPCLTEKNAFYIKVIRGIVVCYVFIFIIIMSPITILIEFYRILKKDRKTLLHLDIVSVNYTPPVVADYMLHLFLSRHNRRQIIGDLTEEFHEDVLPGFGVKAARFWYWKKALSAIVERNPITRGILLGGGLLKIGEWVWKTFAR